MTKARDIASAAPAPSTVSATELGYLDGVSSAIQTQLNGKQAVVANVDSTEIGYLDGVTSSIQTQLNSKAPTASPTFTGTVTLPSTTSIGNVSDTELGYLDGVTSSIQTQLNAKVNLSGATMTGVLSVSGGVNDVTSIGGGSIEISNNSYPGYIDFKNSTAEDYDVRLMQYTTGATGLQVAPVSGGTPNGQFVIRNIYTSTSTPTGGSDGDVWIQYT